MWSFNSGVFLILASSLLVFASVVAERKYQICVVSGGAFNKTKTAIKYCPTLKQDDSKVECVIGNNRIDCITKISEGKADFGVFEAEDIVVASNTKNNDILITNEIRFYDDREFEYEVVAVVQNGANINKLADLQGKNLCHPGYGNEVKWTEVISRFLEARVVPQLCNSSLTLSENRIKSSSNFFRAACKAGPWVPNFNIDSKLKRKYPNLCELCDNPMECSTLDKYWGRRGPLFCLTDGLGDVSWARLDDTQTHFGLSGMPAVVSPKDFSFLCPDGSIVPLTTSTNPCVWLARPWTVIAASKEVASRVQSIVSNLKNLQGGQGWEWGLNRLMSPSSQDLIYPLTSLQTPEDYISKANGFTSANSLSDCTPARPIRLCTRTATEQVKCGWLKEVAKTYGVEPEISCLRAKSSEDCMKIVQGKAADIVIIQPDQLLPAQRDYGLKPLVYEFSTDPENLFNVAAVVRTNSAYKSLEDLRGQKACFPSYEGVGWTALIEFMRNKTLLSNKCPLTKEIGDYFSASCVPGLSNTSKDFQPNLQKLCNNGPVDSLIISNDRNNFSGEMGAFRCLATGVGDVAFINLATIRNNTDDANMASWASNLKSKDFRALCFDNLSKKCYLSWATPGQVMIRSDTTTLREEELFITFLQMDHLFGRRDKIRTPVFQLFGEFNGQKNVLFQDSTHHFEDYDSIQRDGSEPRNYEKLIKHLPVCAGGPTIVLSMAGLLTSVYIHLVGM